MSLQEWFRGPYTPDKFIKLGGAISALVVMIGFLTNSISIAEPYFFATRGYLREHVQQELREQKDLLATIGKSQTELSIRIEEAEHRRIRAKITDLELELKKNPETPEPIRRLIEEQITEQRIELQRKETTVDDLRRIRLRSP